jgi:hypothetical protein
MAFVGSMMGGYAELLSLPSSFKRHPRLHSVRLAICRPELASIDWSPDLRHHLYVCPSLQVDVDVVLAKRLSDQLTESRSARRTLRSRYPDYLACFDVACVFNFRWRSCPTRWEIYLIIRLCLFLRASVISASPSLEQDAGEVYRRCRVTPRCRHPPPATGH